MPESVFLNKELRVIHIKSIGVVTEEDLNQSFGEIQKLKAASPYNRILVDHTKATSFPAPVPAFNFGAVISRLLKGTSIALIDSKHAEDGIDFFQEVVNARGGNAQVFESENAALQWLDK